MPGKILVADDSSVSRTYLQNVLASADFAVTLCDNREALLERLAQESFSLIVIDPTLRDGSGLHIIRDLRSGPGKTATPILVLSSQTEIRRRILAIELGADDVIDKPCHDEYLLDRVWDLTVGPRSMTRLVDGVRPSRILIVDDSVTYGCALAEELRRDGHDVALAQTTRDALSLLAVQSAACVLLDVFMPEVGGVQLCRLLRTDAGMRNTSILVMTGREDISLHRAVLEAGADEFVAKTSDLSLVREQVRDLLKQPRRVRRTPRPSAPPPLAPLASSAPPPLAPLTASAPPPLAPLTSSAPPPLAPLTASAPPPLAPASTRPTALSSQTIPRTATSLLDQVIRESGMSELLGRSTLRRACERAGVDPISMSPGDLARALPFIAQTLGLFIPTDEVQARMERIIALSDRETAA